MENFVISLKSATDRRIHIEEQFGKKEIAFDFFDAIEPHKIDMIADSLKININNCSLSEGEIGCLLSHVSLWKKAFDENIDYIAIFEDDIYLSKDAHFFLSKSDWINHNVDFIKIEKTIDSVLLSLDKINIEFNKYILSNLRCYHLGTGGYILSNKAARDLYQYVLNLDRLDHIDQIMFKFYFNEGSLSIYQITPALCIQDCILNPTHQKFNSTLQWRKNVRIKQKISILKKMQRELFRIYSRLTQIPFRVKLIIRL